jgi:hypothetical protein
MHTTATVCHAGATGELVEESCGLGGVDTQVSLVHQGIRFFGLFAPYCLYESPFAVAQLDPPFDVRC